jgi:hypothetical protein
MENVIPTIYLAHLQTAMLHKIPYAAQQYTTLNEALGIQSGIAIPTGNYPSVGYYAIGDGGHTFAVGGDGIPYPNLYQHQPSDSALFHQMPFVLRLPSNDLAPSQRALYALRKEVTFNNVVYIAYYLRRVDLSSLVVSLQRRTDNGTAVTQTTFTPNASNLAPTPTILSNSNVNVVNADALVASAPLDVTMTPADVAEYVNVAQIIYGNPNRALISESALCCGFDKTITVQASTGPFNYNEAVGVQITSFIADFQMLSYANGGLTKVLDSGANTPLYSLA